MTIDPTSMAARRDDAGDQAVPAVRKEDPGSLSGGTVTPRPSAGPATTLVPKSNPALVTLQVLGSLLFIGGLIAMIAGITRKAPASNQFLSSAADDITDAMKFAATSNLIVLAGGVALMLGGMALVGALIVAAVKASR